MKLSRIIISAMLAAIGCVSATVSAEDKPVIYKPVSGGNALIINAMSANGRYAVSQTQGDENGDNPQPAGGTFINLDTKETLAIIAPKGQASVLDVADNGIVVGSSGLNPGYWEPGTSCWTTYAVPADWGSGVFTAVTPDARYAVGYWREQANEFFVAPMLFDLSTGAEVALTNLPKVDRSGIDNHQNIFYDISPDGRYILGQMSQSHAYPPYLFTYIYDVERQDWKAIGHSFDSATNQFTTTYPGYYFTSSQWMSADGSWVTGTAYIVKESVGRDDNEEFWTPYRYNVDTNTLEVIENGQNVMGNKITNDGVMLCSAPIGTPYPYAYVRSGKFFIPLDLILSQVYGISISRYIGDDITGAFECLSADGKRAVMITHDNCYVISMPETFEEAARKVDLLANFTPSIPAGTSINKLGEISLTFAYDITCKNLPSTVILRAEDGSTAATAVLTAVDPSNPKRLTVTFRTTTMRPGEKYTLRIPAQYISLKDDSSYKSKEINLNYTGRDNTPVKPQTVTPVDGSAVAQIDGYYDPIVITYDTEISISPEFACSLYYEGADEPVASLTGEVDGRTLYLYPLTGAILYVGSDYRVELAAGSITDLSGAGASEVLTLKYKGAYRRQTSDSDIYLFNSHCDDYSGFIFWQSVSPEPCSVPKDWGFRQGQPWGLVRDDETDTNQALAAHSMFATPATSDDWLVTPQIYIPDENVTLQFLAQSYLKSKSDRLKVYVLESNSIINYMSAALAEEFLTSGELICDEILSPGTYEDRLAGDWTSYVYSLKKYVGKDIYIAFVNNNTDQSAVFIDEVCVMRDLDFVVTNHTPKSVVAADDVSVSGSVTINNPLAEYNHLLFTLRNSEGEEVDTYAVDGATLRKGDVVPFEFGRKLPLVIGKTNEYTLGITTDGIDLSYRYEIQDLTFKPEQRVVLEEYTGSECGNCPLGIRAIETLEEQYGEAFIPVMLRTYESDYYGSGLGGYSDFLQCQTVGAPSGRVNRGAILTPACATPSGYKFFGRGIIDEHGIESYLWGDAVADALNTTPYIAVDVTPEYDASTGTVAAEVSFEFAIETTMPLRVFGVLTEDRLPTYQKNGYSTSTDPALGEWGAGGIYSQGIVTTCLFDDVVRGVLTDNLYNGELYPVSEFTTRHYNHTLETTIPEGRIFDSANCHVVAMIIDGASGQIINAAKAPLVMAGVPVVGADNEDISIIAADGCITATGAGEVKIEIYTPAGILLGRADGCGQAIVNASQYKGIVIARASSATASTTAKILIK